MSLLGNLTVGILGNMSGLSGSLKDSQTQIEKFAKSMDDVGKKVADMGTSLSLFVTGPLLAVGGTSLKAASDFESAFAGVRKTVDATEEEFAMFEQGFRDMAKTMPQAATEITRVGEAAGQLGIQNDAILDFTKTMVNLGVATDLSSDQAAMALARFATITQMPQENFERLGSTIVGLGNNLAATESEIVEMGLRIAGAGTTIGMSESDILSFAGALTAMGINAESGGTAFSKLMINIAQSVATGSADLNGFATTAGMTVDQFSELFEKDASMAISYFIDGLGKMNDAGVNVFGVIDDLGLSEVRLRDALLRSASASDVLFDSLEIGRTSWEENNALTKEAEERYKTFASQLQIFKNNITDIAITIGGPLMEAANGLLEQARPLIDMVADLATRFTELDPEIQKNIIAVAAIAAAVGPVLIVVGKLISAVSSLAPVLGLLTNPIGLTVAALAALTAAVVYLYKNNETVKNALDAAWRWIKDQAIAIFDALKAFWNKWGGDIKGFFSRTWELIKSVFMAAIEVISYYVTRIFDEIKAFWDEWGDEIIVGFKAYFKTLKSLWENVFKGVWEFVKRVFDEIKAFWDKWGDTIVQAFKDIFDIAFIIFKNGFEVISRFVKSVFDGIKLFWDVWGDTIITAFKTVFGIVKSVFEGVWNQIKIIIDLAMGVISNVIKLALALLQGDWESAWEAIKGIVESIWEGIKNTLSNVAGTMYNIGKDIIQGLINGIKSLASNVASAAKDIASNVGDNIKGFFGIRSPSRLMMGYGQDIGDGLVIGMREKLRAVGSMAQNMADAAYIGAPDMSIPSISGGNFVSNAASAAIDGHLGGREIVIRMPVYLDGEQISENTSKHQFRQTIESSRSGGAI